MTPPPPPSAPELEGSGGLEAHWAACWSSLAPRLSTLPDQPACLAQLEQELRECFGPLRLVFAHYVKHAATVPAATSPQAGLALTLTLTSPQESLALTLTLNPKP